MVDPGRGLPPSDLFAQALCLASKAMGLDMVMQACNPSSQKAEAGGLEAKVILSSIVNLRPAWATCDSSRKHKSTNQKVAHSLGGGGTHL